MTSNNIRIRARLGTAMAALALGLGTVAAAAPAAAQSTTFKPSSQVLLAKGEGQMITTSQPVADVWVSNPAVADVDVTNPRQIKLYGKDRGEATVIATNRAGAVVYATNVRVSQNLTSVDDVIRAAMPGSDITVTTIGQVAVINGTVASPEEAEQAQSIVAAYLNPGKKASEPLDILPINRLRSATPLQVALKVRIAEVNKSLIKQIGINLFSSDATGGTVGSVNRGAINPISGGGFSLQNIAGGTTFGLGAKLLGVDFIAALDLLETDGVVTTLAQPTLTALSGETASFLAGGEFPVPISQSLGSVSVEYKSYGVALAFTPIVLTDGRISMRVRPEVSELSNEGAVKLGDFIIPAVTTRRAETTVEMGSGQSFMIAGLLRNSNQNSIEKAPFLGDIPILGALFRSTSFRRSETELVVIVTPYLVRPVSGRIPAPTDGYRAPTDAQQMLLGKTYATTPVSSNAAVPATGAAAAPGFKM